MCNEESCEKRAAYGRAYEDDSDNAREVSELEQLRAMKARVEALAREWDRSPTDEAQDAAALVRKALRGEREL